MKIKVFVAREIQYFELGIFNLNSYIYYLTRGFIASNRVFNLLTRAFSLPSRAFNLPTRAFNLLTREFELLTRGFELVTRRFELATRGFEFVTRGFGLVTRGFELVTCVLLFYNFSHLVISVTASILLLNHRLMRNFHARLADPCTNM